MAEMLPTRRAASNRAEFVAMLKNFCLSRRLPMSQAAAFIEQERVSRRAAVRI